MQLIIPLQTIYQSLKSEDATERQHDPKLGTPLLSQDRMGEIMVGIWTQDKQAYYSTICHFQLQISFFAETDTNDDPFFVQIKNFISFKIAES